MPKCPFCKLHTDTGDELQDHLATKHPEEIIDTSGVRKSQQRKHKRMKKPPIVVDGNNIAYYDNNPEVNNIKKARSVLIKEGYKPIIYVSAALRHDIDQPNELNRLLNLGWIIEVEGGQDDDVRIIEEAQRKKCEIITNDNFSEYRDDYTLDDWNLSQSIRNFSFDNGKFSIK